MTATATTSAAELELVDRLTIDETPFSLRWRGVVLGISIVASSAFHPTLPSGPREQAVAPTTLPSRLPELVAWDLQLSPELAPEEDPARSRATFAVEAVERIGALLSVSEERVAGLVGVARGSVRNWRTGAATPYPATVRRLFEVDGVLIALQSALGPQLNLWLLSPGDDGTPRTEILELPDGPTLLGREAARMVFANATSRRLPTADDFGDPTSDRADVPAEPSVARPFAGLAKPRRARS